MALVHAASAFIVANPAILSPPAIRSHAGQRILYPSRPRPLCCSQTCYGGSTDRASSSRSLLSPGLNPSPLLPPSPNLVLFIFTRVILSLSLSLSFSLSLSHAHSLFLSLPLPPSLLSSSLPAFLGPLPIFTSKSASPASSFLSPQLDGTLLPALVPWRNTQTWRVAWGQKTLPRRLAPYYLSANTKAGARLAPVARSDLGTQTTPAVAHALCLPTAGLSPSAIPPDCRGSKPHPGRGLA